MQKPIPQQIPLLNINLKNINSKKEKKDDEEVKDGVPRGKILAGVNDSRVVGNVTNTVGPSIINKNQGL